MELEGKVKHLESEVKDLKILAKELRMDIVEKETRFDHLKKKSDEISSSMSKAKDEVDKEFKSSSANTKLLDKTYAVGFEDFHLDAHEAFPGVYFDSIKHPIGARVHCFQAHLRTLTLMMMPPLLISLQTMLNPRTLNPRMLILRMMPLPVYPSSFYLSL